MRISEWRTDTRSECSFPPCISWILDSRRQVCKKCYPNQPALFERREGMSDILHETVLPLGEFRVSSPSHISGRSDELPPFKVSLPCIYILPRPRIVITWMRSGKNLAFRRLIHYFSFPLSLIRDLSIWGSYRLLF